jgi:hypothetical protein
MKNAPKLRKILEDKLKDEKLRPNIWSSRKDCWELRT